MYLFFASVSAVRRAEPRFCDEWGLEFEGAKQFGRIVDGNRAAGGWMVHSELKYHADALFGCRSVLSTALTYYSGDRHWTGDDDDDKSWDPMWARYTQDSEMLVYGSLYENCWWSNMIYAKAYTAPLLPRRRRDSSAPHPHRQVHPR